MATLNFAPEDLLRVYTNPQIPNVPDIDPWEAEAYAPALKAGMEKHGIDNRREAAHFLAQVGYETGCLNWLEEFGGRQNAIRFGYGGGADFYGRGNAMTTHAANYETVGDLMGAPDLAGRPGLIGCVNDDPVEWPRNIRLCMESACAFWKSRGFDRFAAKGDDGFDDIMLRWLGQAEGHPSYWDRWALYRAMINKLPRPFVVPSGAGGLRPTQKQRDKEGGGLPDLDVTRADTA